LTGSVTNIAPAGTAARRTRSSESRCPSIPFDGDTQPGKAETVVPTLGITVYGCGPEEAALFREIAPRFGVLPTITEAAPSEATSELASGARCISVGHKTNITCSTLLALRRVGVRHISTRSVGYNHIDVPYAKSLGISVENVAYSPDSVADYTLMLMLMAVRRAKSTLQRVRVHDYRLDDVCGGELRDMTIGVIGTGRIGASVLDRLGGFGCRVLANDRCRNTPADYVSLDELMGQSDIVTLHTPLTADTHHLLNRRRMDQMKAGAFIINTARGALLDTAALLEALETGRLSGAALDVLEGEEGVFYCDHRKRLVENQLLLRLQRLPNVIITPHTAFYTDHALRDIVQNTLSSCLRFEERAA
jgi:D-specific alpha-keto acid dehydrogenase